MCFFLLDRPSNLLASRADYLFYKSFRLACNKIIERLYLTNINFTRIIVTANYKHWMLYLITLIVNKTNRQLRATLIIMCLPITVYIVSKRCINQTLYVPSLPVITVSMRLLDFNLLDYVSLPSWFHVPSFFTIYFAYLMINCDFHWLSCHRPVLNRSPGFQPEFNRSENRWRQTDRSDLGSLIGRFKLGSVKPPEESERDGESKNSWRSRRVIAPRFISAGTCQKRLERK